eukprot:gb/GFBE01073879.1/.p1 GENE.gb/GFBE01073879.1/~~gb/GFBE01073879.1/.p1  ORF type:complete len:594 (+),score=63.05 gb/GFBE01073879.1/:1-1782(+)
MQCLCCSGEHRQARNGSLANRPSWRMLLAALVASLQTVAVHADYFPSVNAKETWQRPLMQPWDPLRALKTSITVSWTPAWNPWTSVDRYELQARRPGGDPLRLADLESLRYREADVEDETWPGDDEWTTWKTVYVGVGRAFTLQVPDLTAHAAQFRVRACGDPASLAGPGPSEVGCSAWSPIQTAHTILSAPKDKINFIVRGTGMNAPTYTHIEVNRQVIYRRRDETGLVLAVFRRLDFSLQWLRTYDTHRNRTAALEMATHLRHFNASYFVVVASTIAWEWQAPRSLVQTMEFCGAYHFGQWSHIFAEQVHYHSNTSDLQQTSSQQEFGHPYAFVGIPGIGSGMGWESLMYNTGHYLAKTVKTQEAIVRGIAYFDYVARIFRLQDVTATKALFYAKAQPPLPETLHNPTPARKKPEIDLFSIASMQPAYTPYVGTLRAHITKVLEANGTVEPYNFAFVLTTDARIFKVDPRPRSWWLTELEKLWGGPSMRFWAHNQSMLYFGKTDDQRSCARFVTYTHLQADPQSCGPDFEDCCASIDQPELPIVECGIGVSPTLCRGAEIEMANCTGQIGITNKTHQDKWPCPFWVIDWES